MKKGKFSLLLCLVLIGSMLMLSACNKDKDDKKKHAEENNLFQNGLLAIPSADNKYGYIDKTGKYIINPQFDEAYPFTDNGLARVQTGDRYGFAELAAMAEENPVDVELDVNDQRFLSPENMTAEIEKAAGRELTIGQTAFAIFDNLAKSYAESLNALEALTGERYETLNIIGGGSKNGFLNALTKKYTGKTIVTGPTEGTALGNLLAQMLGEKEIPDLLTGRKIIEKSFDVKEVE